jgi:hypothetical protein
MEAISWAYRQLPGERIMRFIIGLILGAALTVAGAFIHDTMEAGAAKPLVNWTNAGELEKATFDYVKDQADRLIKWATNQVKGDKN